MYKWLLSEPLPVNKLFAIHYLLLPGIFRYFTGMFANSFYLFGILLFRILTNCLLQNKLIPRLANRKITIIPSHHNNSGLFSILLGSKCQLGRNCKLFSRELLHQQIRNFPEVHKLFREAACIKTDKSQIGSKPVRCLFLLACHCHCNPKCRVLNSSLSGGVAIG